MSWSKKMAERTAPTLSGVVIALALIGMSQFPGPLTTLLVRLDGIAYDLRLSASLPTHSVPDERIVIVTIDERGLADGGRWPWSRAIFSQTLPINCSRRA
jgi:adenylate cyclase